MYRNFRRDDATPYRPTFPKRLANVATGRLADIANLSNGVRVRGPDKNRAGISRMTRLVPAPCRIRSPGDSNICSSCATFLRGQLSA